MSNKNIATSPSLEKRVLVIEARNSRVEADKAWETSFFRKIFIALLTYLVLGFYMAVVGVVNPWINAVIPTLGFLLSTLTLSFIKSIWAKFIYHR